MSEKTESTEKKAPVTHQPKKESSGSSGAFLAMVISLCAAGGSYYIWQQHLVAEQDRLALRKSIQALLETVEVSNRAQMERIDQLQRHEHNRDEIEQRIGALEQTLPEMQQQLTIQRQEWTLAEVDYLLRIAEHRLQLNRDLPTAITALSQARDQLISHTNGDFAGVITAIDQQIDHLAQLQQESPAHITNQLSGLIAAVDSLPVVPATQGEVQFHEPPAPPAGDAEFSEKAKYWGRMVWHDLKSLVTIRRSDDSPLTHPEPQQRTLLQTQLRIKLETARLAATAHDQPLYQATLAEAGELLGRYFDGSDNAVSGARASIEMLAALQVDAPPPSMAGVRQQLHTAQQQRRRLPPQPEPQSMPEPMLMPESQPMPVPAPMEQPAAPVMPEGVAPQSGRAPAPFWGAQP